VELGVGRGRSRTIKEDSWPALVGSGRQLAVDGRDGEATGGLLLEEFRQQVAHGAWRRKKPCAKPSRRSRQDERRQWRPLKCWLERTPRGGLDPERAHEPG